MPTKIVDFSACSEIIRDEPWHLHFWESSPQEILGFLQNPRGELARMGIELPEDCRIETVIENHDWISAHTSGLTAADGVVVCNVGGGNVAKNFYRVAMYGHDEAEVGKFEKTLLHSADEDSRRS